MTNDDPTTSDAHPRGEVREGQRIAKVMARAGLCSRREAEAWINAGRVAVNGVLLESPAYNVSDADDVRVDGKPLAARERTRLFLFHKPRGLVTTARDPEGRPTIFDALPDELPRVVAIGRLDINTEGLLLLTNDGGLARILELPSTGWLRRYRVRAHGEVAQATLDALREGVTVEGVNYAGIDARLDREQGSNAWITMGLREGKNREIKKVLEHIGLAVNRLIRVSFGPFELGDLADGEVVEVRTRVLKDQIGAKLAREAGVDFDAPIVEREEPEPAPPRRDRAGRGGPPDGDRSRRSPGAAPGARRTGRDEPPPRWTPPPPSTPERKRKHVSALRAEIAADAAGAANPQASRKRTARGATQDRKGRTVAVERISQARRESDVMPVGGSPPRDRAKTPGRAPAREGGFAPRAPRKGPAREGGQREDRGFAPRAPRPGPPRERRSDRPGGERAERRPEGARPPRRFEGEATSRPRPPREGGERGERSFAPRAGPARERRSDRPDGERAERRPEGARPPRRFEGEGASRPRPPRGGGEREQRGFAPRERSERRTEGGPPRAGPRGGDRPGGRPPGRGSGKPGGKPGGKPHGQGPRGGPGRPPHKR